MTLKNKNGNAVSYDGNFAGVRCSKGKFYAAFTSNIIREVPQSSTGYSQDCNISYTEFNTFPKAIKSKVRK